MNIPNTEELRKEILYTRMRYAFSNQRDCKVSLEQFGSLAPYLRSLGYKLDIDGANLIIKFDFNPIKATTTAAKEKTVDEHMREILNRIFEQQDSSTPKELTFEVPIPVAEQFNNTELMGVNIQHNYNPVMVPKGHCILTITIKKIKEIDKILKITEIYTALTKIPKPCMSALGYNFLPQEVVDAAARYIRENTKIHVETRPSYGTPTRYTIWVEYNK